MHRTPPLSHLELVERARHALHRPRPGGPAHNDLGQQRVVVPAERPSTARMMLECAGWQVGLCRLDGAGWAVQVGRCRLDGAGWTVQVALCRLDCAQHSAATATAFDLLAWGSCYAAQHSDAPSDDVSCPPLGAPADHVARAQGTVQADAGPPRRAVRLQTPTVRLQGQGAGVAAGGGEGLL